MTLPQTAKNTVLFAGLTPQEQESLAGAGRIRAIARGQPLFAQGDKVAQFFLLTRGIVQLYRVSPEGKQKTIALVPAGHPLCEDEIMDGCANHRTSAVAVEDSEVLEFPAGWLKQAAKGNGAFALNLLSLIAGRAQQAELEAEHQASMSAAQLVACFMQRLCVLHDFSPKGFELPYSKTLIASRLGMELETFSRTLGKLKDHGIVVEGNHVAITDLARIEEYVCSACSISGECATHRTMEKKMG